MLPGLDYVRLFLIVLVHNIAHDALQNILHGHQPGSAAVLIYHNGHLDTLVRHGGEQLAAGNTLRYKQRLPHIVRQPGARRHRLTHKGQQVFYIENALHIIQILVKYRDPGAPCLQCKGSGITDGGRLLHCLDLCAMGHNILRTKSVKIKDIVNHLPLRRFQFSFGLVLVHQLANFLFRCALALK